jgi:frataxin-like iron-binding protein CyaY
LEESRKLQQFEKEADETKAWINEKLKIATDVSYKVENVVITIQLDRPTLSFVDVQ